MTRRYARAKNGQRANYHTPLNTGKTTTIVYNRPRKICSICNSFDVASKIDGDKFICPKCYAKLYRPKRICSICGEKGTIFKIIDNKDICSKCYYKQYLPKRVCSICGKIDTVNKIADGDYICRSCYRKTYLPKRICSICNCIGYISKIVNGKLICSKCYNKSFKPQKICTICNIEGSVAKIVDKNVICHKCYNKFYREKRICSICSKINITTKVVNNNESVCPNCYRKHYQPKRLCSICGRNSIIVETIDGNDICNSCYQKFPCICQECQSETTCYLHSEKICINCYYKKKLTQFIDSVKDTFVNKFVLSLYEKFTIELKENRTPQTTYTLINLFFPLFKRLDNIDFTGDVSNEHFENICNDLHYNTRLSIQNFFIKEKILKPVKPIDDFNKLYNSYLNKLKPSYKFVYQSYVDYLLKIRNSFNNKGWTNKFNFETCGNYAYISYIFLDFLSNEIESINEVNNELINSFCNCANSRSSRIRHFVKWINKNVHLFIKLNIPEANRSNDINPYSEKELLLIYESLSAYKTTYKEKIICYLLLLYAIRPFELRTLKLSDYKREHDNVSLYVRNTCIKVNPLVSEILDNYIKYEYSCNLSLGNSENWLFPGTHYNEPLSIKYIYHILYRHHINSNRGFSTALTNSLISTSCLPSSIIKGLGVSKDTVIKYNNILNNNTFEFLEEHLIVPAKEILIKNDLYESKYYVYILKCLDGSYYTGYTSNLEQRITQHNSGSGSEYTKTRRPVELVYTEEFADKTFALKREKQIKKLDVYKKEQLIQKSGIEK